MPGLRLNFLGILFRSDRNVPREGVLYHEQKLEQKLLNIPAQNYGEEYVKRYVDRFSSC